MKKGYVIIPLTTLCVAFLGSYFTSQGIGEWYPTINKPSFTPPGSIIGAVWSVLYVLVTLSALIIYKTKVSKKFSKIDKQIVYGVFLVNALLNAFWSYLFFVLHTFGTATLESGLMALTIFYLIVRVWPVNRPAAFLLIPYAAWVSFATYLTYSVWLLN